MSFASVVLTFLIATASGANASLSRARDTIRICAATARPNRRHKSSYFHHLGCQPLHYVTLGQALERSANTWPDRTAVISKEDGNSLKYSELLQKADQLGAALLEIGLEPGDRVGIWCPNSTQWIVTMMAATRTGLISVAINPSYEKKEIAYCLKQVGVNCLVVHEKVKQRDYYRMLTELLPGLAASTPGKLSDTDLPDLKAVVVASDNDLSGVYNLDKLVSSGGALAAGQVGRRQHLISPDSGCNIQFTSGTTGKPKAPLLSHHSMVNNGFSTGIRNELSLGHAKICVQVPLFHAYGVIAAISGGIQHGATLVLPSSTYSPSANVRALIEEKCTTVFGTPTMYVDLVGALSRSESDGFAPRVAVTGGALVSPQLIKDMYKVLKLQTVKSICGMTETTAVSFQSLPGEDPLTPTFSVGHVLDHVEVKVCDNDGHMVEFGSPGELYVRGYFAMLGYWGDEEKTKEVIGGGGWVRTGDQVVLNENGYCNVVGRLKDIIIRGGENIAPREIEDVISAIPEVLECHVFALTDERLGEEICAAVRLRDGATLTPQDISRHCSGQLAQFKLPRLIKQVDSFPKTTSGKIQKFKLRQMAENREI